jgi:hypothetical protein
MLHQRISFPQKKIKETNSVVVTKQGRYTLTAIEQGELE